MLLIHTGAFVKKIVYKHMQAVMQVWYECAFNDVNKHFKV